MEFLPLDAKNWITRGNALKLDWLSICPPTGTGVKLRGDDLFATPLKQPEIDFENEGGETYICGNPPYLGGQWQSDEQKADLKAIFETHTNRWKPLDYVTGWFMKAADYGTRTKTVSAFVATNSICQGRQVPILWPLIFGTGHEIAFAHTSLKWANLASHNAGVTVIIVGISNHAGKVPRLYSFAEDGKTVVRETDNINAYLVSAKNVTVQESKEPMSGLSEMFFGNMPNDGGHLLLARDEMDALGLTEGQHTQFVRHFYGSAEFIKGTQRYCLWIPDELAGEAMEIDSIRKRVEAVSKMRLSSKRKTTNDLSSTPYRFGEVRQKGNEVSIVVPRVSSENRDYLPVGLAPRGTIIGDRNFALYDAPLWNMALIASRLHWVWIGTVCVRLRTDFSYSNTLGWNTFPVPKLTGKNKADLTECAENILLAREAHFPATIADLYKPDAMPENLRAAHVRNDEVLERIYIGRRFKNDTERLEKLFEMLDSYEADCDLSGRKTDMTVLDKARGIVARLGGKPASTEAPQAIDDFLHREFTIPNIQNLPIEEHAVPIIKNRLKEARAAMGAGAYLSPVLRQMSILRDYVFRFSKPHSRAFPEKGGNCRKNSG